MREKQNELILRKSREIFEYFEAKKKIKITRLTPKINPEKSIK